MESLFIEQFDVYIWKKTLMTGFVVQGHIFKPYILQTAIRLLENQH